MSETSTGPLSDRIAVVTGATGGIGAAITSRLHGNGAKVAMLARRGRRLERIAAKLGGDRLLPLRADVVDPFDLVEARDEIHDRFGRVDLVVVTAGIMSSAPFEDAIPAEWNAMIDINAKGLLQTAQTFAHDLLAAAKTGRPADLVMMGSVGARQQQRNFAVYSAVYASVAQLSRHLRTEFGAKGVRVRMISPYYAQTGAADTEDDRQRDMWESPREESDTISPTRVADLVAMTCGLPARINLAEAVIRPTRTGLPMPALNIVKLRATWLRFTTSNISGAALLVIASVIALIWANVGGDAYDNFWHTSFALRIGRVDLDLDLRHWINDALMALFFLTVSLEVKHDLVMGDLHDPVQARLPLIAAVAGLVIPAAIFVAINPGSDTTIAWGVVISTDTAFVLGLMALFGSGIPAPLRAFILTLAVADDIGALAVIAVVYTEQIVIAPLIAALAGAALIYLMGRIQIWRVATYVVISGLVWLSVYASGVHATIAGVLVGLLLPVFPPQRRRVQEAETLTAAFRRTPTAATGRAAAAGITRSISVNERLQRMLHSYVVLLIVPVFALANAGVHITGPVLAKAADSRLFWGIVAGLVIGKFVGVLLTTMAAAKLKLGVLSPGLKSRHIAGGAMLTGIGFTISLFIIDLAINDPKLQALARIGVLVASLVAAVVGLVAFTLITRYDRAHAPARMRLVRPVDFESDHLLGIRTARLQLVEYGRFGGTDDDLTVEIIENLHDRFDADLVYVFRHNPLGDPVAEQAAEAIEAVGAQAPRLFWRMRTELAHISVDSELDVHEIRRATVTVGANLNRMEESLRRGTFASRVNRDVLDAETMRLTTTPRFFINDEIYDGPVELKAMTQALQAALDSTQDSAAETAANSTAG